MIFNSIFGFFLIKFELILHVQALMSPNRFAIFFNNKSLVSLTIESLMQIHCATNYNSILKATSLSRVSVQGSPANQNRLYDSKIENDLEMVRGHSTLMTNFTSL